MADPDFRVITGSGTEARVNQTSGFLGVIADVGAASVITAASIKVVRELFGGGDKGLVSECADFLKKDPTSKAILVCVASMAAWFLAMLGVAVLYKLDHQLALIVGGGMVSSLMVGAMIFLALGDARARAVTAATQAETDEKVRKDQLVAALGEMAKQQAIAKALEKK